MTAKCIGGMPDHVHLLLSVPSTMAIAKAVQLIKGGSAKWIHENAREWSRADWTKCKGQEGYGAFGTSASLIAAVVEYI